MGEDVIQFAEMIAAIVSVFTLLFAAIKAFLQIRDGLKCLLRADMMRSYYQHREEDKIPEYEGQNFALEYEAYKKLGGNSFIDTIHKEVVSWDVVR